MMSTRSIKNIPLRLLQKSLFVIPEVFIGNPVFFKIKDFWIHAFAGMTAKAVSSIHLQEAPLLRICLIIGSLMLLLLPSIPYAAMSDYCLVPPYVMRAGVPPNITLVYEKGAAIVNGAYNTPLVDVAYDSTKTYYGFFKSTASYSYNSASEYFEQPSTACTPTGANNCFSGNLLNWAFMSSLDLARKALIGFGWDDTIPGAPLAGDAFTYSGNFCSGSWTSNGTVCSNQTLTPISYIDLEDGNRCIDKGTVNIGGTDYTYAFELKQTGANPSTLVQIRVKTGTTGPACSGACSGTCSTIITLGASGKTLAMKITDEPRTGLIQKYADKDTNYQYDTDVPRFGVKRWNTGAAQQEDIIQDSPLLTSTQRATFFRNLLSAISKSPGSDPSTAYLGDMHKQIVNYYKGSSSTYEDNDNVSSQTPYNWATDPLKACRKTFAFYVTTGRYVGQDSNKLSPLPSACTSLKYDDGTPVTEAFPTNTCYAYNTDLYTADGSPPKQNITTYVVHTTFYGSGTANGPILEYAANISDGEYLEVDDPLAIEEGIEEAILAMLERSASGTAASVLASGEGSGANLVQATFYPRTPKIPLGMFDTKIAWAGRLSNFWYYVDPKFTTSTILEETTADTMLNLSTDKTVTLRYDLTNEYAVGDCYTYSTGASANCGLGSTPVRLEFLKTLWDAGVLLWNRDVAANKRKIYTTINGTGFLPGNFSQDTNNGDSDNAATLLPYLNLTTLATDDLNGNSSVNEVADAGILIRYMHGEDFTSYSWMRSRTTKIDLNGNGTITDTVNGISESPAKVWKLGDVLNSTPRISSWIQLNTYDQIYSDTTYNKFIRDLNDDFTAKALPVYTNRGMVFTGANDGMLHAFKLGDLGIPNSSHTAGCTFGSNDKACLSGTDLGKEMWAFIPKNVLPYLKYLTDTGYCHLYSVDLSPYIFDASIGDSSTLDISSSIRDVDSWRTILIGGMRFGGACKPKNVTCSTDTPDSVCAPAEVSGTSVGFSSYFALDVTDQNNPTLLWEFSDPALGFTTTSPAVVRVNAINPITGNPDKTLNGKWFVVFGSGPTGPISTLQFLGRSDQNLKIFVLDLKSGVQATTPIDTGISRAFAGSMINVTHDADLNYSDDVLYISYVKKAGDGTWTDGGVLRLSTKEDINPNNWVESTVKDGIGPVTSSIVKLQSTKKGQLWLYFGTGRYYFEQFATVDDADSQRKLYGVLEPCYTSSGFNASCTSSVSGSLTDVTLDASAVAATVASTGGWYISLDASGSYTYIEGGSSITRSYRAERVITDPVSTTTGLVFFTTYKPYSDICAYGGKTFIWAVKYATGGAPGALLKGTALLQVSTGAIEQIDLSTAFTDAGGRKSVALEGVPPTQQGLAIMSTPPPVERTIHIRER